MGERSTLQVVILLDAQGLTASRPGKPLFDDLSLTIRTGDRLAVVGINGSGKSTLLAQLAGWIAPEAGTIRRGRSARVVVLDQQAVLAAGTSDVVPTVLDAAGGGWQAEAVLERIGLGGIGDRPVDGLSGGQAKRVALARALVDVGEPGHDDESVILILDEPTNHLDVDAIAWLEERLAAHRGALVMVSHDRHLLDRVTTRILEIDRGGTYLHDGGYDSYLQAQVDRAAQADQAEAVRQNLARRELAWLRRGAKARTSKSKARIDAAHELIDRRPLAAARPASLDLGDAMRVESGGARGGQAGYTAAAKLARSGTPRLGDLVIDVNDVGHRFADSAWLFRHATFSIGPGDRLGVLGPNGSGKTTLTEIIAGAISPVEGSVTVGPTVVMGVHRQNGPALDPAMTVRQAVAGPGRVPDHHDALLMEQFWFGTDAQYAPIALLSGGERRRLQLLLTLAKRPNVLILDEPTNDLDLDTLRVLEDYLVDWPGAMILVSHDRTFLERTVTEVIKIEDAEVSRVPGGYQAWEDSRVKARTENRRGTTASTVIAHGDAPTSEPAAQTSGNAGAPPMAKKRSASTLRFLLKDVERDQRRLERRREALTTQVQDPSVIADYEALTTAGRELAQVEAELARVEHAWLELTLESESL